LAESGVDFRQLKYFMAVARAKSLTKASETLHVAQPAVSQQIQRLEEELGELLLLRHSRGVELTEAGVRLEAHARSIMDLLEEAGRDLRDFKGEPQGSVRLGMPHSICGLIGSSLLEESARRWPRIKLKLAERMSDGITELLFEGHLDLGLTFNREESERITYEPLMTEHLCLICSKDFKVPGAVGDTVAFGQLANIPLVLPAVYGVRALIESEARSAGISLNVAYEADSVPVVVDLIETGRVATVHPVGSIAKAVQAQRLRGYRVVKPNLRRVLYLAYGASVARSKAFTALQGLVREQIPAAIEAYRSLGPLSYEVQEAK
jgi:LysR family nitrogen assimilation transcriptional regulator